MCSNVLKFVRRKIGEIVRYLPENKNKILAASQTVATDRIAPTEPLFSPRKRRSMFLPALVWFVCMSVCVSVCDHDN